MRNSRRHRRPCAALGLALLLLAPGLSGAPALAQERAQGFAVERLYLSAPGAGWLVLDTLQMQGPLAGAIALTTSYAHEPLRLPAADGGRRLALVAGQAFAEVAVAASYERFRLSLGFVSPLVSNGHSGSQGPYRFTAPPLNLGQDPDGLSDTRLGFDARVLGDAHSPLRLGAGVQLWIPAGARDDYVTDATYRAMGRLTLAGDAGRIAYAAQLGVHLRPLDDAAVPGSPRGSELLFGAAVGTKLALGGEYVVVVGPELFGDSALRAFLRGPTSGLEALLSARLEQTGPASTHLRVKLGAGAGLQPELGTPQWRLVLAVEMASDVSSQQR